jgi:hypothetical protein
MSRSSGTREERKALVGGPTYPLDVEVQSYGSSAREEKAHQGVFLREDASFFVVCLVIFTGDTARGVLFPTLYPRIAAMGGNRITQGITVGVPFILALLSYSLS